MTTTIDLSKALDRFGGTRVLCVGDLMLDRFVYGKVTRISPEAPIPVLRVERETAMLGAMGNVLANIASLGGKPSAATVIGDDDGGKILQGLLSEVGIDKGVIVDPARLTTVKTRFVSGAQQMLRADRETPQALTGREEDELVASVAGLADEADVIVISDYAKGVVTLRVARALIEVSHRRRIPILVDSKPVSFGYFAGATILKPNRRELSDATGMPVDTDEDIIAAAHRLMAIAEVDTLIVTRSEQGQSIITKNGNPIHMRAKTREVFEASGAGDTTLATLALAVGSGATLVEAAELANYAAGIVVGKMGTAAVRQTELREALDDERVQSSHKIKSLADAVDDAERWRTRGVRVGFTNGCFDLLHPGHISILRQARSACDRLIVGLNSDASVKRLKGESRPVNDEHARAAVLSALEDVDAVVIFNQDTPKEIIEQLRPDVLVKGADYTLENVVGAKFVMSYGGKVVLADLKQGHSTTSMIGRMKG